MTSRRAFLKLSALGLAGALLPAGTGRASSLPDQFGRILVDAARSYTRPTPRSKSLMTLYLDDVVRIADLAIGDDLGGGNPVWYFGEDTGYIHSSLVQPVQFRLNPALEALPADGLLAEVTIPFTDAFRGPGKDYSFAYRLYYQTTHWVNEIRLSRTGEAWYRILDDTQPRPYFARAAHLRLIPVEETEPISTHVAEIEKWLRVDLSAQTVTAFESNRAVFIAKMSSGAENSQGKSLTPLGYFSTFYKRPSRHMTSSNLAHSGYDLPGVPWVCYFTNWGIAFHGAYWHNSFGQPVSHGCINLTPNDARWIYRWTSPSVPHGKRELTTDRGTRVEVLES